MRKLIVAVCAAIAWSVAAPSPASAQDVQAQRLQRRAEMQQRLAERRVERLQRLAERRPELKQRIEQRIEQRIAAGKRVRPLARKQMLERRVKRMRTLGPEMFDQLDLNKDGVLSRDEWRPRVKRKV